MRVSMCWHLRIRRVIMKALNTSQMMDEVGARSDAVEEARTDQENHTWRSSLRNRTCRSPCVPCLPNHISSLYYVIRILRCGLNTHRDNDKASVFHTASALIPVRLAYALGMNMVLSSPGRCNLQDAAKCSTCDCVS